MKWRSHWISYLCTTFFCPSSISDSLLLCRQHSQALLSIECWQQHDVNDAWGIGACLLFLLLISVLLVLVLFDDGKNWKNDDEEWFKMQIRLRITIIIIEKKSTVSVDMRWWETSTPFGLEEFYICHTKTKNKKKTTWRKNHHRTNKIIYFT